MTDLGDPLGALISKWLNKAKELRRDTSYTDCAATLESCANEIMHVEIARLEKIDHAQCEHEYNQRAEECDLLRKSLAWALNQANDIIEVGGVLECIHCRQSVFQEADKSIKHTEKCPYALALTLVKAN
jgi:hypothetical protein